MGIYLRERFSHAYNRSMNKIKGNIPSAKDFFSTAEGWVVTLVGLAVVSVLGSLAYVAITSL